MTEDRESRQSQAFWFRIIDVDGDGVLGVHDMRWLYDQIWKDGADMCIAFEDLVCQVCPQPATLNPEPAAPNPGTLNPEP
jgi:hypothetical protein